MKFFKAISIVIILLSSCTLENDFSVASVTCEMAKNPIALLSDAPRFSWQIVSNKNNVSQKSYQIIVSSTEENLENNIGDIWDSGIVHSNKSQLVSYPNKNLKKETKYFWKVKIWNQDNKASSWSETAFFRLAPETSSLKPTWIGPITKADSHLPE